MNIKPWLIAARLRTLPLAVSGILLGTSIAQLRKPIDLSVVLLAVLTAFLLQILSNFANDYGDFVKGTDSKADRQDRALASGSIDVFHMKRAVIITGVLAFFTGISLIYRSFQMQLLTLNSAYFLFGMGLFSLAAAVFYTIGKRAYGYSGWGDFFVFVFFGLLPVLGMSLLLGVELSLESYLGGCGLGFLSVGVLNLNNYRDIDTDKENGKITLAVRLGPKKTLWYQRLLLILGFGGVFLSFALYVKSLFDLGGRSSNLELFLVFGVFSPIAVFLARYYSETKLLLPGHREELNKQLKNLSLTTMLLVFVHLGMVNYIISLIGY
jgi:1,4-dihydroxy-2-naphthoate octaprenyltransferase